jgi:hypothetical protein
MFPFVCPLSTRPVHRPQQRTHIQEDLQLDLLCTLCYQNNERGKVSDSTAACNNWQWNAFIVKYRCVCKTTLWTQQHIQMGTLLDIHADVGSVCHMLLLLLLQH